MKIAELENAYHHYIELELEIQNSIARKQPYPALALCCDAISHAVPAYKFHKRKSVPLELPFSPLSTLCDFAPPLFEREALVTAINLIQTDRTLKKEAADFVPKLEDALVTQELACKIWNRLEKFGVTSSDELTTLFSMDPVKLSQIVSVWNNLGIVKIATLDQGNEAIDLCTKWDATVEAYCYGCGVRGKGKKERLFQPVKCTRCERDGYFFISSITPTD